MYYCDICGRAITKPNYMAKRCLCSKHMHQLHKYNKFLDNYIDESLGRDGIYVSTNSTLTRISLPLIEDDEITRVVDNLEVNI